MASALEDILTTTDTALGTITGGITGFRKALETGKSRTEVDTREQWDPKTVALWVGGGLVAVLALVFVVKKIL